jgi:WD40 repeat protein
VIELPRLLRFPDADGQVYSVAWSPTSDFVASGSFAEFKIWDVIEGIEAAVKTGNIRYIWGVDWSPDGALVASAGPSWVYLLNGETLEPVKDIKVSGAFCISWSPDSQHVAVGSQSGNTFIIDTASGEEVFAYPGISLVVSVDWSPNGRWIATGFLNGRVEVWDAQTGMLVYALSGYTNQRADVNGLAWSPDGAYLATAHQDGYVRIWHAADGTLYRSIKASERNWSRGIAWSPGGGMIATGGQDKRMHVFSVETAYELAVFRADRPVWAVAWSPDGTMIAVGSGFYNFTTPNDGRVYILDASALFDGE